MATLVRYREPFREVAALQNEMTRLMGGLLEGNGRTNQAWAPAVDVWETDDDIVSTCRASRRTRSRSSSRTTR